MSKTCADMNFIPIFILLYPTEVVSGKYLLEMKPGLCLVGGHLHFTRNSTQSYIQVRVL